MNHQLTKFKQLGMLGCALALTLTRPALAVIAEHSPPDSKSQTEQQAPIEIDSSAKTVSSADALDPFDDVWRSAPARMVPLYQQSIVQPYGGGSINEVDARVLRLEKGLAVRLSWADSTRDDNRSPGQFKDSAAIEFPLNKNPNASLAMGHAGGAVNIWHWSAAREKVGGKRNLKDRGERIAASAAASPVEDLVAAGFYNREPKARQVLSGHGVWRDGQWSVVFFKPFGEEDPNSPGFESQKEIPVAFAVWNGSAGDRLGLKSVSNWALLKLP